MFCCHFCVIFVWPPLFRPLTSFCSAPAWISPRRPGHSWPLDNSIFCLCLLLLSVVWELYPPWVLTLEQQILASSYSCLLILKACHGPRPQPLHIPSCFATTFTQLRTGKNPLFCHLTVRTAFSALRVGVSSQEKNTLIILFMLRIASESCTRLVGWADVPTRRLGTSPAENSSPLDEGDVISVCEWLVASDEWCWALFSHQTLPKGPLGARHCVR